MLKVLYIYRHHDMGYSIGRVFKPIEEEMRKYCEVDAVYLPVPNYSLKGLWKNIWTARKAVKQKHYDVVHITGAEHYLIPFLKKQNVVVTVHDMQSLYIEKRSFRSWLKKQLFVKSLKNAPCLTFISNSTKDECYSLAGVITKHQYVIGNPVPVEYQFTSHAFNYEKPIILHVGTKWNKNLHNTIVALCGLNVHLRIIGVLSSEQIQSLQELEVEYSNVFNITGEEMLHEYQNCDIVNFPSLYEGFGMPIIEGQAIGRVVVTSEISPMRDVAGNGALFVNPTDEESIRNAYLSLLQNPVQWETLVNKGLENVKRFDVHAISQMHYRVYSNLLSS